MAQHNARDCVFEIESETPATWLEIGDINTFSKSHEEETADTTTFASQGQAESQKMQIGKELELEGIRNSTDPGQQRVEAASELLGNASLIKIRFHYDGDTEWIVWNARVNLGDQGGGNNDKVSWSATFTRSGAETKEAIVV
ncbi:hypothetical protein GCM10010294_24930 [Streptomyces griseoloalbus]|uniref:phage tail tube protein n=1 Tax=Streptomyces griseoloalbus TaxID=67303 RepID=UPI00187361CF|nr:hypothetical protein GCM10010294_24930 [Streptomyces griseoloalbus]